MRSVVVVIAAFVTFATRAAGAGEPTAEDLIVRGLELRRAAKPDQALGMFQRAHALAPSPRTLGQMGLVETSLEHWLEAEAHMAAALVTPDEPWVRKNRAFLQQALKVSRRHIGELGFTGPDGTAVAINGRHAGTLPAAQPVRLVEGAAVVTANGAGFKDFSKTVTIAGGAKVSLAIVLDQIQKRVAVAVGAPVPLPSAAVPLPEEAAPSAAASAPSIVADAADASGRSWKTPVGVGMVTVGAGLLAWGITWVAVDRKDTCPTGGPACNEVLDTKAAGWLLTAGGAAAAGAGAVLLYLGHRSASSNVAFDVTPTSLSLRGQF